jgi:IS4 transposase
VARELTAKAGSADFWFARRVKVVDGSSASMPDTPANQAEYPQPSGQKPGCGFPVVAFVAVFCLATGALLALSMGKWFLHDLSLFYFVRDAFAFGDILLADRGFCSYAELALLKQRGVDSVLRLHQRRRPDFRRGRILGLEDHVVTWTKPERRSRGLREEDYRRLPDSLKVREVRYQVAVKGFRTREVTLATTLLDAENYFPEALAELHFLRWDVELDFRHLKTTMQMDVLRCKTPSMVRKEIWTHLLAYNLIRSVMWEAARRGSARARQLSVKGSLQHVLSFREARACADPSATLGELLLKLVGQQVVPYRPDRIEPRVRKRRPKNYPLMTRPRSELTATLRS